MNERANGPRGASPFSWLARLPRVGLGLVALAVVALWGGCSPADDGDPGDGDDDYGIEGPLSPSGPVAKGDDAGIPGPYVNTWTADTQVWTARNAWEDTDTDAARAAGIAWPADSGLTWDEKYSAWIDSMLREDGHDVSWDTFTLTTPWNKSVPAPKLECAELAIFLRVTFAAWYELPFYLTAVDGQGTRVFFGHFGARTKTKRYKNTPLYAYWYKDYSDWTLTELADKGWPEDAKLRSRGLYGGGDDMPFIAEGAVAGTYFDEVHLNKRVGHFLRLILGYFGSMHLADSRNTFNLVPEALAAGDVLVERWQKHGIGHTLVVKRVEPIAAGLLEAEVVSGSMPRRQPKWESPVATKLYFTDETTGGPGTNTDGIPYVELGGGIKRFRVTKNINGYWTNSWMASDEANWINDNDHASISERPSRFDTLLGEATPEARRDALIAIVEDARNHLRQYPASCAARAKREEAFAALYELLAEHFDMSASEVDAAYRSREDYVFGELEYASSKTCCWNSSTAAMHQIIMDYDASLATDACVEPVVFKARDGGYQIFADYAAATGRGHLWKPWNDDESCPQADVDEDTEIGNVTAYCSLPDAPNDGGDSDGGCSDDGYEDNDSTATATPVGAGQHGGLMICGGDDDVFAIDVPSGKTLTANIAFSHAEGDLDLSLSAGSGELQSSTSVSDSETVSLSGAGTYYLRVYGYQGAQAAYQLTVTLQ